MDKLAEIQKQHNEAQFLAEHHDKLSKNFYRSVVVLEGMYQQEQARLAAEQKEAEAPVETPAGISKEDLEEV